MTFWGSGKGLYHDMVRSTWMYSFVKIVQLRFVHFNACKFHLKMGIHCTILFISFA